MLELGEGGRGLYPALSRVYIYIYIYIYICKGACPHIYPLLTIVFEPAAYFSKSK